jgi:predicted nucleic acid-binding Zn ribbon protein
MGGQLHTCVVCGARFHGRADAVYCSPSCRQRAHRVRTTERLAAALDVLHAQAAQPSDADLGGRVARALHEARASVTRARSLCEQSRVLCAPPLRGDEGAP